MTICRSPIREVLLKRLAEEGKRMDRQRNFGLPCQVIPIRNGAKYRTMILNENWIAKVEVKP